MTQNFAAFDYIYAKGYLIGEMIWNFADFATKQGWNNSLQYFDWSRWRMILFIEPFQMWNEP